jgi:hypothetical protein
MATPQITVLSSETIVDSKNSQLYQNRKSLSNSFSSPSNGSQGAEPLEIAAAITGARPPASQRSVAVGFKK